MFNLKKRTFWKPFWGILFLSTFSSSLYAGPTVHVGLSQDNRSITSASISGLNTYPSTWKCSGGDTAHRLTVTGYVNLMQLTPSGVYDWATKYVTLTNPFSTALGNTDCYSQLETLRDRLGSGYYQLSVSSLQAGKHGTGRVSYAGFSTLYGRSGGVMYPDPPSPPPPPPHSCKASNMDINFGSFTPGESNTTIEKNLSISCNYTANITLSTPADTINFSNAGDSGFRAVVAPVAGSFPLQVKANQSVSVPLKAMLKANCPDLLCVPQQAYSGSTSLIIAFD